MWEETPIQKLSGLVNFNLYSYKVPESHFTCNQGTESVSFQLVFQYTHVMTIECIIICWGILATCDYVVSIYHFVHRLYSLCASPQV